MAYYHILTPWTEQPFAGVAVGHNSSRRGSLCQTGQYAHTASSLKCCTFRKMMSGKIVMGSKLLHSKDRRAPTRTTTNAYERHTTAVCQMRQQLQNTTLAILSASHYHGFQRVFYECTDQEGHMRCNQCLKATARPDNA